MRLGAKTPEQRWIWEAEIRAAADSCSVVSTPSLHSSSSSSVNICYLFLLLCHLLATSSRIFLSLPATSTRTPSLPLVPFSFLYFLASLGFSHPCDCCIAVVRSRHSFIGSFTRSSRPPPPTSPPGSFCNITYYDRILPLTYIIFNCYFLCFMVMYF